MGFLVFFSGEFRNRRGRNEVDIFCHPLQKVVLILLISSIVSHHEVSEEENPPHVVIRGWQVKLVSNQLVSICTCNKANIELSINMASARRQVPPGDSKCLLCLGGLNNPVVLRCDHWLCKSCVQSSWEMTKSLKCPVCLRGTSCKVSLQNVSSKMSGSGLLLGSTEGTMVSACLSRLFLIAFKSS